MQLRDSFKAVLFVFVLLSGITLAHTAPAQEAAPQARKFDEFGDVQLSDLKARLDNFAIEIEHSSETRGFLMVYRSRRDLPGLSGRLAQLMRNYLVYTRGLQAGRIIAVDGGEASCLWQELWIVPVGATPKPRDDAYVRAFVDTDSARKFDEYYYYMPQDSEMQDSDYDYTDKGNSLETYAAALRQEPRALAYVIVYPQYYVERWEDGEEGRSKTRTRTHLDGRGTADKILRKVRAELVKTYHIASSRIRVVDGGYRKSRTVELWIVPRGEHAPIPTPNAFPKSSR